MTPCICGLFQSYAQAVYRGQDWFGTIHQHDPQFIIVEHQYACCDVIWKHSITLGLDGMRIHCTLLQSASPAPRHIFQIIIKFSRIKIQLLFCFQAYISVSVLKMNVISYTVLWGTWPPWSVPWDGCQNILLVKWILPTGLVMGKQLLRDWDKLHCLVHKASCLQCTQLYRVFFNLTLSKCK